MSDMGIETLLAVDEASVVLATVGLRLLDEGWDPTRTGELPDVDEFMPVRDVEGVVELRGVETLSGVVLDVVVVAGLEVCVVLDELEERERLDELDDIGFGGLADTAVDVALDELEEPEELDVVGLASVEVPVVLVKVEVVVRDEDVCDDEDDDEDDDELDDAAAGGNI